MSRNKSSRRRFMAAGVAAAMGAAAVEGQTAPAGAGAGAGAGGGAGKYPVLDSVDVLVVGGGPAGIGAALGAARAGAKTMLVENHSFFGGVAAWSMGMQINQVRPKGRPRSAVHELLVKKIQAYGDAAVRMGTHELWCNVEYLKVAVLDALEEVRCRYLVHTRAADAIVEGGRITGVVVCTKRGLMAIRAKAVVDCTGDGDVAHYAGAETLMEPGPTMPMTLGFALTHINADKVKPDEVRKAIHAAREKHPLVPSGFIEVRPIANTSNWYVNHSGTFDFGRLDGTDPEQRTRAECLGRRQVLQMAEALRESSNPELARIELIGTGPQLSVRETRRVKGVYIVTEEDAAAGRRFEDTIAWRSGFLDPGGLPGFGSMKIHDVPYRAILPEKLDGLLMAGRCISATHMGAAAGKSMGNCMATGHAAGLAAAMCAAGNVMPRELAVKKLQEKLRGDGVDLVMEDRGQEGLRL